MKKWYHNKEIYIYLLVYFGISLLFLDRFPFMHSDESWLSGLTRAMMAGGLDSTEPFFDLLPRNPHAIKLLFHLLQMPFISVFGYNLFAVRLVSLVFGTATLYIVYRLARHLSGSGKMALVLTVLLSFDVQFLYASHFARQDIIIAFGIVAIVYYCIVFADTWSAKRDLVAGMLIGLFIGVHPNSLIIALCAGFLYLYYIFEKKRSLKNLALLVLTVAAFAGLFVGISYAFDAHFIVNYAQFGHTLGVDLNLVQKLDALPLYYAKLFLGISGTYFTPPIQPQLIFFGAGLLAAAVLAFFKRELLRLLLPFVAISVGFVLIGRYAQPAVILLFPLGYLLIFAVLGTLIKKCRWLQALALGAVVLLNSVIAVIPYLNNNYGEYLSRIRAHVPKDAKVLANLNSEFAFDNGQLLDYRNLEYLQTQGLDFKTYVSTRGIEYILYPEEMDFIYENRPVWNILYGNLHPYCDDMVAFLDESCVKTGAFSSPYAMRIPAYAHSREWKLTVYRVKEDSQ